MTFIASVVAKKGVAIIADSLVTSQLPILHYKAFIDHIDNLPKNANGETVVDPDAIRELFNHEPIYTKDYEEKLFQLNSNTAITTTGIAYINDKSIADHIEDFKRTTANLDDPAVELNVKIDLLVRYLNAQVTEHIKKYSSIGYCMLIITHYEKHTHKTYITKAIIQERGSEMIVNPQFNYLTLEPEDGWIKVVCEGQNKISDSILYGFGKQLYNYFTPLMQKVIEKLPAGTVLPDTFIEDLRKDPFFNKLFISDIEMLNLTELSVQQAADLASLLMRLEVDFQKYTKNVPTVGGLIKLAVIDEEGFRFISGHDILAPKHLNL